MIKDLDLLGLKVKDKITGFTGVVTSVGYDLFGCIQGVVSPSADGVKLEDARWMDTKRFEVLDRTPVMEPPNFDVTSKAPVIGGQVKPIPERY